MNKKKLSLAVLVAFTILAAKNSSAIATGYEFPQCTSVSELHVKVEHTNGTHGVPGRITNYTGSDTVYELDQNNYLQCLCPDQSDGIKSDWLYVGDNEYDIESYVQDGWIFVADGSLWGLHDGSYLVKNSDYNCKPTSNNDVGGTITEEAASTSSDSVLGLANTGTDKYILTFFVSGIVLFFTGKKLRA